VVRHPGDISLGGGLTMGCIGEFRCLDSVVEAGSGAGGGEMGSRARVRCAWAKFRELAPVLTSRGASLGVGEQGL